MISNEMFEAFLFHQFESVLNLIIDSYYEIKKDGKKVRKGPDGYDLDNNMPLENSLTNMLIIYLREKRKTAYGLELLIFDAEPAEIGEQNESKGFLDIKVGNATLKYSGEPDENIYYAFECKRLNDSNYGSYVNDGILRFIEEKYSKNMSFAGMIGYFEVNNIEIKDIISKINNNLANKFNRGKLKEKSQLDKLEIQKRFKYSYISNHERKTRNHIDLYHLIFDYNNIIDA